MENKIRTDLFRPMAVLALAGAVEPLSASVAVAARAYRGRVQDTVRERRTLEVKGLAVKRVKSDTAVWYVGVRGEAPTLKEAYEKLDGGFQRVRSFLTELGIPEAEVEVSAIGTDTHYRRDEKGVETNDVAGYTLQRGMTVTTAALDKIAAAAGERRVDRRGFPRRRLRAGVPLLGAFGAEDRADGARGARRADAGGADRRERRWPVGELVDAQMGVLQITRPLSTETTGSGVYDTDRSRRTWRAVGVDRHLPRRAALSTSTALPAIVSSGTGAARS